MIGKIRSDKLDCRDRYRIGERERAGESCNLIGEAVWLISSAGQITETSHIRWHITVAQGVVISRLVQ